MHKTNPIENDPKMSESEHGIFTNDLDSYAGEQNHAERQNDGHTSDWTQKYENEVYTFM